MGKKKDRKQKGKGAEKTALKTEVNEEKKSRKRIKEQEVSGTITNKQN